MENVDENIRKKQQGFGRPIIHADFQGHKVTAVGNRVYFDKQAKTFHDFLQSFFVLTIKEYWGEKAFSEFQKNPIIKFYKKVKSKLIKESKKNSNKSGILSIKETGFSRCFFILSYSLYQIKHNGISAKEFRELMKRIKNCDNFWGVFYELYVANIMIRSGFKLEFEDETDSTTTHGEFIAIDEDSGKRFWIEAKCVQPKSKKSDNSDNYTRVRNQIYKALKKKTNDTRIVFIEICSPNCLKNGSPAWYQPLKDDIKKAESELTIDKKPAPESYLIFTSHEMLCDLHRQDFQKVIMGEGFKKPDFGNDISFSSLKVALAAREKHRLVDNILETMRDFQIPSTFDGSIPEFSFNTNLANQRLIIGQKYLLQDKDGKDIVAKLVQAHVNQFKPEYWGVYEMEDGSQSIYSGDLSQEEFEAYKRYPNEFFGVYQKVSKNSDNPLDLYDFFYRTYSKTSEEKLLEFMNSSNDPELASKTQNELADMYCQRLVYSALHSISQN